MAIEQQFALTAHADNYIRVSSRCWNCHTSQGFVANATGGTPDFSAGAAHINCRTCHQVHQTYEGADFALTTTDPVTLIVTGNEVDVGDGNLCASCHQGRDEDSYPQYDAPVDSQFELGNHYDFHHGPQVNVNQGEFPVEVLYGIDQGTTFGSHAPVTCTDCHMALVDGDTVATFDLPDPTPGGELGHNFAPSDEICNACHTNDVSDEGFDHNGVRTNVGAVLADLQACLAAEGVIDNATGEWHGVIDDDATEGTNEGLHPEPYVAAYLVFATLSEDGSMGAHNPSFVVAWLDATMTAMDANSTDTACDYTSPF